MFRCEAVGLEFLDSAPVLLGTTVTVNRPPDEVFAAFAHDPATWGEFFPASTAAVTTTLPARTAWAPGTQSDSSASPLKSGCWPGMKANASHPASKEQASRCFTPGSRTIGSSRMAATEPNRRRSSGTGVMLARCTVVLYPGRQG